MLPNILGKKKLQGFLPQKNKMPNPSSIDNLKRQHQVGK
jgi:hypothetical protein